MVTTMITNEKEELNETREASGTTATSEYPRPNPNEASGVVGVLEFQPLSLNSFPELLRNNKVKDAYQFVPELPCRA